MSAENKKAVTAEFAVSLRRIRRARRLTQRELAEKIGVGEMTYVRYETGRITPGVDKLKALAEVLEVPVAELLGMDESDRLDEEVAALEMDHAFKAAVQLGLCTQYQTGVVTVSPPLHEEKSVKLKLTDFILKMQTLENYALTLPRARKAALDAFFGELN